MALSEKQKEYAISKMEGKKPKFRKGVYGKQYDSHSCGDCGHVIAVINNFCPNCGCRILWDEPRCLTDYPKAGDTE